MLQPIKIQRPEIYQKIRSRLGVRAGIGRSAELLMAIQPTLDIDPLLLETRVHHNSTVDVDGVTGTNEFQVPAGEFWHCKSLSLETVAGSDFSLYFRAVVVRQEDGQKQAAPLSNLHVFSGIDLFQVPLVGITLRPGDDIGWESLVWVAAGGSALFSLMYDLEDCSS